MLYSRSMWNSSLYLSGIAVSGLMLRLKAKELADNPEFKASLGWYQNWKRRHSCQHVNENNPCATSSEWHGGENRRVPSLCDSSQAAVWSSFVPNLQYGRDSNALRAAVNPFVGIQWKLNSPSEIMRRRKAKLHGNPWSRSRWDKTTASSHVQRCTNPSRPGCS